MAQGPFPNPPDDLDLDNPKPPDPPGAARPETEVRTH